MVLERKNVTFEEVLAQQNIEFKASYSENHFMVIAKDDVISVSDIPIIKQIRKTDKLIILNSKEPTYSDYRGGEYIFATYLVTKIALPVLVACLSSWITNKMLSYRACAAENQKTPKISVNIFRTEKSELIRIKAEDPEDVLKILKELRDQNDAG